MSQDIFEEYDFKNNTFTLTEMEEILEKFNINLVDFSNQLEIIRRDGYCNMLNRMGVKDVAEQLGFDEIVKVCDLEDEFAGSRSSGIPS